MNKLLSRGASQNYVLGKVNGIGLSPSIPERSNTEHRSI
jgi:hypothetical protein